VVDLPWGEIRESEIAPSHVAQGSGIFRVRRKKLLQRGAVQTCAYATSNVMDSSIGHTDDLSELKKEPRFSSLPLTSPPNKIPRNGDALTLLAFPAFLSNGKITE